MPWAVNDARDLGSVISGSVAVWLDSVGRYREGVIVHTPDGWQLTGAGFPPFPLVGDKGLAVARLTVADRWPVGFTVLELLDGTTVHLKRERSAPGMVAGHTLDGLAVAVPLSTVRLAR